MSVEENVVTKTLSYFVDNQITFLDGLFAPVFRQYKTKISNLIVSNMIRPNGC